MVPGLVACRLSRRPDSMRLGPGTVELHYRYDQWSIANL